MTKKETESYFKTSQKVNAQDQLTALMDSIKYLQKVIHYPFSNFFKNIKGRILPYLFYEKNIPLIQKEKYRIVFLINIDIKILNKMLANRIQQHIKRFICHDALRLIPETQGQFKLCIFMMRYAILVERRLQMTESQEI